MIRSEASCNILDLDYAKIDNMDENADFSLFHSAQVLSNLFEGLCLKALYPNFHLDQTKKLKAKSIWHRGWIMDHV